MIIWNPSCLICAHLIRDPTGKTAYCDCGHMDRMNSDTDCVDYEPERIDTDGYV